MDQDHGTFLSQGMADPGCEATDILSVQEIDDFREKDEVKQTFGPLLWHEHLLETYAREIGASAPRLDEGS